MFNRTNKLFFVLTAILVAAIIVISHTKNVQKHNSDVYGEICDDFIKEYVAAVNSLKDFIERNDSTDAMIYRVDSLAFGFCEKTDLLEYNIYAIDRNLYWDSKSCIR